MVASLEMETGNGGVRLMLHLTYYIPVTPIASEFHVVQYSLQFTTNWSLLCQVETFKLAYFIWLMRKCCFIKLK